MATIPQLQMMADRLRSESIQSTTAAGSGHPTTCLSAAEIMSALFFSEFTRWDEFILSKGHAAPILWAVYAESGIIDRKDLASLRKIDSPLEGHPTPRMPMVRVATGSLGQGLSAGAGMALAKRLKQEEGHVFVLLGDGECAEGSVWEAANTAAYYKLCNLVAVVDVNGLGQSQETMHRHDTEAYRRKFVAFGWNAWTIDGHDIGAILRAFARARKSGKPAAIIARTLKGRGVSFTEGRDGWHGKPLNREEMEKALGEISNTGISLPSALSQAKKQESTSQVDFPITAYKPGEMVATRTAFGKALISWGRVDPHVVAIDADVKNSTMMEGFFKEFPERAFQSFIAEQNMVGMAIGFSALGFRPVAATFAAFLTRAYDFIRMGIYSQADIQFAGSHAGISIGPDGPSQMGLEDISMFLALPGTRVFYPSDAVSCEYCLREMARHRGISYLRTTREKTPVIYSPAETFPVGGLKVLRYSEQDQAVVIAAGITLHEALKAHDHLKQKGIHLRVIDLYCPKPLPEAELRELVSQVGGKAITAEDHYDFGIGTLVSGLFPGVVKLCVREIPRSGPMAELLEMYGISAAAIVRATENILK